MSSSKISNRNLFKGAFRNYFVDSSYVYFRYFEQRYPVNSFKDVCMELRTSKAITDDSSVEVPELLQGSGKNWALENDLDDFLNKSL